MSEQEKVWHVLAHDSGHGTDGSPVRSAWLAQPGLLPETLQQHMSQAIALGLQWNAISPAYVQFGGEVLKLAKELRNIGFSAAWVQELISVGQGNNMLMAMLGQRLK